MVTRAKFKVGDVVVLNPVTEFMQKRPELFGGGTLKAGTRGMVTAVVGGFHRSYNIRLNNGKVLRHIPEKIGNKFVMRLSI